MEQKIYIVRIKDFPEDNLENLLSLTAVKSEDAEEIQYKYIVSEFHSDPNVLNCGRMTSKELICNTQNGDEQIKKLSLANCKTPSEYGALTSLSIQEEILCKHIETPKDGWEYEEKEGSEYQIVIKKPIWAQLLVEGNHQTMSSSEPTAWSIIKEYIKEFPYYCPERQNIEFINPKAEILCVMRNENQEIIYKTMTEATIEPDEIVLVLYANNSTLN